MLYFPFPTIFNFLVGIISDLAKLKIVEVNAGIFAYDNSPPAPHHGAEHETEGELSKEFIDFWLEFLLYFIFFEELLILWELFIFGKTIAVNESLLKLLIVFRFFIEGEVWGFFDIVIESRFGEIVSNIVNGIIVSRVLIIDEDVFVVGVSNQNVTRQQIIVRKHETVLL